MIQDWKDFHKSMLYLFKLAEAKQVQIDLFNYLLDDYFYKLGQADHDTFEQDFDLFDALSSDILLIANKSILRGTLLIFLPFVQIFLIQCTKR